MEILYVLLFVWGFCFVMSGIAGVLAWASNNVEAFLVLVAIAGGILWVITRRDNARLEEERIEAENKAQREAQQKAREEQLKKTQLENSVKYGKLKELFGTLKPYREAIVLKLNTPAEFNKYDKMLALYVAYNEISSKYKFFDDNHFSDKLKNISAMPYSFSGYVKEKEETLVKSITNSIKTPVQVTWIYTSPAGRSTRSNSAYITREDLQEYERHREEYTNSITSEQARRERERQLITPGLRYDIMKRDNFRCKLCGRSAQDGVTLEVDHIKPVSKGGKTELNNLWTLCRDCNRGKGAKYDEDDD